MKIKGEFSTKAVLATFNSRASVWNIKKSHIGNKEGESRRLFRLLDTLDLSNATVLDLGCGTGKVSQHISSTQPSAEIMAVDISLAMLQNFLCPSFKGLRLLSEASKICLSKELCDVCVCQQVLHHTPHPWRVLKEIARIIKKDGFLLLLTVGPGYHDSIFPYQANTTIQEDPLGRASQLEITQLIKNAGFQVCKLINDTFSFTFGSYDNYFNFLLSIGSIHKIHGYHEPPIGYREKLREQVIASQIKQGQTNGLEVKGHYITVLAKKLPQSTKECEC